MEKRRGSRSSAGTSRRRGSLSSAGGKALRMNSKRNRLDAALAGMGNVRADLQDKAAWRLKGVLASDGVDGLYERSAIPTSERHGEQPIYQQSGGPHLLFFIAEKDLWCIGKNHSSDDFNNDYLFYGEVDGQGSGVSHIRKWFRRSGEDWAEDANISAVPKMKTAFVGPMLLTFFLGGLITTLMLNINSWMSPFGWASQEWYVNLYKKENWANTWSNTMLTFCIVSVCVIYITDMRYWRRIVKYFYLVLCCCIACAFLAWAALNNYPFTTIAISIAAVVIATFSVRRKVFSKHVMPKKYAALGECIAFAAMAIILFALWLWWFLNGGHEFIDGEGDDWQDGDIVRTFAPCITAVGYGLIAFFANLRRRWHSSGLEESDHINLGPEFRISMIVLSGLVGMVWVAMLIGIADAEVSAFILNSALMALVCVGIYVLRWIGTKRLTALAAESPTLATIFAIFSSDWFKAAAIIFLGWIAPVLAFIEVLHQFVRMRFVSLGLLVLEEDDDEGEGEDEQQAEDTGPEALQEQGDSQNTNIGAEQNWWTFEFEQWRERLLEWDYTSILTKSMWLGIIVFSIIVIFGKGLSITSVYLNAYLIPWSIPATMAMLFVVVFLLFLFPPISGIILYLTASLILVPKVWQLKSMFPDAQQRFYLGIIVSSLFCLFCKLVACAFQIKVFGGKYKNDASIKKFCGLHTMFMKSIRYVLSTPGNIIPKISILCGCPDWPTSVFCGILDLPLLPLLAGTIPAIFVIAPTCASSAFLLCYEDQGGPFTKSECTALQGLMLTIGAVIQQTLQFMAIFYAQVLVDHLGELPDDWMKDPQEDEMLALAASDEKEYEFYKAQTKFEGLPKYVRISLISGTLLSVVYFAMQLAVTGWGPIDIAKSPEENFGSGGSWTAVVYWSGWVQIYCFGGTVFFIFLFQRWSGKNVTDFTSQPSAATPEIQSEGGMAAKLLEPDAEMPAANPAGGPAKSSEVEMAS